MPWAAEDRAATAAPCPCGSEALSVRPSANDPEIAMTRHGRWIVLAGALLAAPAEAATVIVEAAGVESGDGPVFASLCAGGLDESRCVFGQTAAARPGAMRFTFRQVPAGAYAVAVYQDVNGNGRLDRTPLGLPLEPYGLSNEAGRSSRPVFEAAAVAVEEPGTTVRVRLGRIPRGRP